MKNTKRMAVLVVLGLLSMMFTSCKALIGNGDMTVLYIIANVVIAAGFFALDLFVDGWIKREYFPHKKKEEVGIIKIWYYGLSEIVIVIFMFLFRPFACFNLIALIALLALFTTDKLLTIKSLRKVIEKKNEHNSYEAGVQELQSNSENDSSK